MSQTSKVSRSNRANFLLSEETAIGETPSSPVMFEILFTGETLKEAGVSIESAIIREDRLVEDVTRVARSVEGTLSTELRVGNVEPILEGSLGCDVGAGTWRIVGHPITFSIAASTQKITRVGGSWVADGFAVNQKVRVRGTTNTANTGVWNVKSVTADDLELENGTASLVDETCPTTAVVIGLQGSTTVNVNLSSSSVDNSFGRASGSFVSDGFKVGQWFSAYGFTNAANKGPHRITSVAATKIIVDSNSTLVTESAAAGRALHGTLYRNSAAVLKSYLAEKSFADVSGGFFLSLRGLRFGKLTVSVEAEQFVTLEAEVMGFRGISATSTIAGSTSPAASSNLSPSIAAGVNVGTLLVDHATDSNFTLSAATIELDNNLDKVSIVTQEFPHEIVQGNSSVSGSDSILFSSRAVYQRYENQTSFAKSMRFTNPAGDGFVVTVAKQLYPEGLDVNATAQNETILVDGAFVGVADPVTGCSLQFDRFIA